MKNKKLALSVLSTAVVGSMASSAFALEPGIYIGGSADKHYSIAGFLNQLEQDRDNFLDGVVNPNLSKVVYVDPSKKGVNLLEFIQGSEDDLNEALKNLTAADFDADTYTLENGQSWKASEDQDLQPAPAGELKVESVSANNLKQIKVVFNNELDANTVVASNFKLNGADLTTDDSVDLLDSKTVVITLDDANVFANQDVVKVKVTGIKDKNGNKVADTEKEITVFDNTTPAYANKAELVDKNVLRLYFSEPIDTVNAGNIEINGGAVAIASATETNNYDEYYVDITTGSNLAGTYSVKLKAGAVTDYAGFKNSESTFDVTVQPAAAPITASLVSATQTKVVVKFSNKLDTSKLDKGLFFHSYSTYVPDSITVLSDDTVQLNFTTYPLPQGAVKLYIKQQSTDGTKAIVDKFGNKLATTTATLDLTVNADTSAPTISEFKMVSAKSFTVTFSEAVDSADAVNRNNYTFKTADGNIAESTALDAQGHPLTTPTLSADGKTVTITLASDLDPGSYQLVVSNIKDRALTPNKLTSETKSFTVADATTPALTGAELFADSKTILVTFNKELDEASAKTLANYTIVDVTNSKNRALPTGTNIVFDSTKKAVKIILPKTVTDLEWGTTLKVLVTNVKDVNGNTIVADGTDNIQTINFTPSAPAVVADGSGNKAVLTAKNEFKIYLDKPLLTLDKTKFSAGTTEITDVTYENKGGKLADGTPYAAVVTVKIKGAITNPADLNADITAAQNAWKGLNGQALGASGESIDKDAEIVDKVGAEVALTADGDYDINTITDSNGQISQIEIAYTEDVTAENKAYYKVAGNTVASASASGNVVTLTLGTPVSETDTKFVVSQVAPVLDAAGNVSATFTNYESLDEAGVAITKAEITDAGTGGAWGDDANDVLTLTFSEAIKLKATDADTSTAGIQLSAADLQAILGSGAFTVSSALDLGTAKVTATVSGNTLTLKTSAAFTDGTVDDGATVGPASATDLVEDFAGNDLVAVTVAEEN